MVKLRTLTDRAALDAIARTLHGKEWSPDELEAIATLVRETGRVIGPPSANAEAERRTG